MENEDLRTFTFFPLPEEEEKWAVCKDYPAYSVSTFGRVRNNKTGHILRSKPHSDRIYPLVHLRTDVPNSNGKYIYIHRLVAEAFCEKPDVDEALEIDHINRIRNDNYYKNLRWTTHLKNNNNRDLPRPRVFKNKTQIVLLDNETNELIEEFENVIEASEKVGLAIPQIIRNIHGTRANFTIGYFMTKKNYQQILEQI